MVQIAVSDCDVNFGKCEYIFELEQEKWSTVRLRPGQQGKSQYTIQVLYMNSHSIYQGKQLDPPGILSNLQTTGVRLVKYKLCTSHHNHSMMMSLKLI